MLDQRTRGRLELEQLALELERLALLGRLARARHRRVRVLAVLVRRRRVHPRLPRRAEMVGQRGRRSCSLSKAPR